MIPLFILVGLCAGATMRLKDVDGADDKPGQKDVNSFGISYDHIGDAKPYTAFSLSLDQTTFSGSNTGDGCFLLDCNGNALADISICGSVETVAGNTVMKDATLHTCKDNNAFRCFHTKKDNVALPIGDALGTTSCYSRTIDDPFHAGQKDIDIVCNVYQSQWGSCSIINACSYPSSEPNSSPSDCVGDLSKPQGYWGVAFDILAAGGTVPDGATFDIVVDSVVVGVVAVKNGVGETDLFSIALGDHAFQLVPQSGAAYTVIDISCDNGTPLDESDDTSDGSFNLQLFEFEHCAVELSCDAACLAVEVNPPVLESWPFYAIDESDKKSADELLQDLDLRDALPAAFDGIELVSKGQASELLAVASSAIDADRFELRDAETNALLGGVELSKGKRVTEHSLSVCTRFIGGRLLRVQRVVRGGIAVSEGVIELPSDDDVEGKSAMRVNHLVLEVHTDRVILLSSWTPQSYALDNAPTFVGVVVAQLWTPLAFGSVHTKVLQAIVNHWRTGVQADGIVVDTTVVAPPKARELTSVAAPFDVAVNGTEDLSIPPRKYFKSVGSLPPANTLAAVHFETIDYVFPHAIVLAVYTWKAHNITIGGRCWEAASTEHVPAAIQIQVSGSSFAAVTDAKDDTVLRRYNQLPYRAVIVVQLPQCADVVFEAASSDVVLQDAVFTNLGYAFSFSASGNQRFTARDRRDGLIDAWKDARTSHVIVPQTYPVPTDRIRGTSDDARIAGRAMAKEKEISKDEIVLPGNTALGLAGTFGERGFAGVARHLVARGAGVDMSKVKFVEVHVVRRGTDELTFHVQIESGDGANAKSIRGSDFAIDATKDGAACTSVVRVPLEKSRLRGTQAIESDLFDSDGNEQDVDVDSVLSNVHTISIVFKGRRGDEYDVTVDDIVFRLTDAGDIKVDGTMCPTTTMPTASDASAVSISAALLGLTFLL